MPPAEGKPLQRSDLAPYVQDLYDLRKYMKTEVISKASATKCHRSCYEAANTHVLGNLTCLDTLRSGTQAHWGQFVYRKQLNSESVRRIYQRGKLVNLAAMSVYLKITRSKTLTEATMTPEPRRIVGIVMECRREVFDKFILRPVLEHVISVVRQSMGKSKKGQRTAAVLRELNEHIPVPPEKSSDPLRSVVKAMVPRMWGDDEDREETNKALYDEQLLNGSVAHAAAAGAGAGGGESTEGRKASARRQRQQRQQRLQQKRKQRWENAKTNRLAFESYRAEARRKRRQKAEKRRAEEELRAEKRRREEELRQAQAYEGVDATAFFLLEQSDTEWYPAVDS